MYELKYDIKHQRSVIEKMWIDLYNINPIWGCLGFTTQSEMVLRCLVWRTLMGCVCSVEISDIKKHEFIDCYTVPPCTTFTSSAPFPAQRPSAHLEAVLQKEGPHYSPINYNDLWVEWRLWYKNKCCSIENSVDWEHVVCIDIYDIIYNCDFIFFTGRDRISQES